MKQTWARKPSSTCGMKRWSVLKLLTGLEQNLPTAATWTSPDKKVTRSPRA